MKTSRRHSAAVAYLAVVLCSLPAAAQACTVCMGDPNSKVAGAMNAAIFLMIGCIGLMLGSLAIFGFYLSRRASDGFVALAGSADEPTDNPR